MQGWKRLVTTVTIQRALGTAVSKDQLFTRTYPWEQGEVVVVGNRRSIADEVPEVIEAEFVFEHGKLITAHVLRFKP
jgi:hypothetical protein